MSRTPRIFTSVMYCAAVLPLAFAGVADAALPAHAVVNGGAGFDFGAYSVHADPLTTNDPDQAKAYDNFSLGMAYVVNGINWHGIYAEPIPSPGANVDFLVQIWGDDAGMPDLNDMKAEWYLVHGPATASVGTTGDVTRSVPDNGAHVSPLTATTPGGGPAVQYDAALTPAHLGPGDYWISIQSVQLFNSPVAVDPEWQWHLGDSGAADGFFAADLTLNPGAGVKGVLVQDGSVNPPAKDLAFELKGVVPEPSSFALAMAAVVSVGLLRKKRS